MKRHYIYVLKDDTDTIFYIGVTHNPSTRLKHHCKATLRERQIGYRSAMNTIIYQMALENKIPTMWILAHTEDRMLARRIEKSLIQTTTHLLANVKDCSPQHRLYPELAKN